MGKTLLFDSNPVLVTSNVETNSDKSSTWSNAQDVKKIIIDKLWYASQEPYLSSIDIYHRTDNIRLQENYFIEVSQDDFVDDIHRSLNYNVDDTSDAPNNWAFEPFKLDKTKHFYIRAKVLDETDIKLQPKYKNSNDNDGSYVINASNREQNVICQINFNTLSSDNIKQSDKNVINVAKNISENNNFISKNYIDIKTNKIQLHGQNPTSWADAQGITKIIIDKIWLENCKSLLESITCISRSGDKKQQTRYYLEVSQDDFVTKVKSYDIHEEQPENGTTWHFTPFEIDKSKNLYLRGIDINGNIVQMSPRVNITRIQGDTSKIDSINGEFLWICNYKLNTEDAFIKGSLDFTAENKKAIDTISVSSTNNVSISSANEPTFVDSDSQSYTFITTKSLALSKIDQAIQAGQDAETAKQESISAKNTAVSAKTDAESAKADAEAAKGLAEDAKDQALIAAELSADSFSRAVNAEEAAEGFAEEARRACGFGKVVELELDETGLQPKEDFKLLQHNYKYFVKAKTGLNLGDVTLKDDNATCELWMDFVDDPTTITTLTMPRAYWLDGSGTNNTQAYIPSTPGRYHYTLRKETTVIDGVSKSQLVGNMSYSYPFIS